MDNIFNDNSIAKILEGLQGAKELLETHVTKEMIDQMTDEQKADFEKAKKLTSKESLREMSKDLINLTENY